MSSLQATAVPAESSFHSSRGVSISPDQAVDLYSLWNRVFAGSRDSGDGKDGVSSPTESELPSEASMPRTGLAQTRIPADERVPDQSASKQGDDRSPDNLPRANEPEGSGSRAMAGVAVVDARLIRGAAVVQPRTWLPAGEGAQSDALAGPRGASGVAAAPNAAEATSEMEMTPALDLELAAAPGEMGRDSVNVFVRGSMVAIIVRDTAIEDTEALDCAFETAQKLTGVRAALQQLTLNGRVLYQQRTEAAGAEPSAVPSLVFTC